MKNSNKAEMYERRKEVQYSGAKALKLDQFVSWTRFGATEQEPLIDSMFTRFTFLIYRGAGNVNILFYRQTHLQRSA